jgi:hypothetical protein
MKVLRFVLGLAVMFQLIFVLLDVELIPMIYLLYVLVVYYVVLLVRQREELPLLFKKDKLKTISVVLVILLYLYLK